MLRNASRRERVLTLEGGVGGAQIRLLETIGVAHLGSYGRLRSTQEVIVPAHPAQPTQFTAIIEREGDGFVALCPELDVASQGDTIEEARENLREAVELFLDAADPAEIEERLHSEVYVTHFALAVG